MTAVSTFQHNEARVHRLTISVGAIAFSALLFALMKAGTILPPGFWLKAAVFPSIADPAQLLFHHSFLARVVIVVISGAALALAGSIFQHVLHNPLAEPATLGVSAGAQLATSIALLWAPGLLEIVPGLVAFIGSAAALGFVMMLASANSFSPIVLVIAGLVVTLVCGSVNAVLVVLNHDFGNSLFLFQIGSLAQNGWMPARNLLIEAVPLAFLAAIMIRPLDMMGLEDEGARSLGLSVNRVRILLLALAVALGACVTSAIGVIGFVGLAAPALAGALGARTIRQRLVWAPLLGASLLVLTDQIVQILTFVPQEIPAGAVTGLLGAPLLIWLTSRSRISGASLPRQTIIAPRLSAVASRRLMIGGSLALLVGLLLALFLSRTPDGWEFASWSELALLSPWRTPRVFASLACGAMLATAGVLMQRMTGNAMASPEVLGVSSGAAVSVIFTMLLIPGFDPAWTFPMACAGAALTLVTLLTVAGRSSFSPGSLASSWCRHRVIHVGSLIDCANKRRSTHRNIDLLDGGIDLWS